MPRTVYFNYAFERDTQDLFKISEYVFPTLLYLIMHTKSWFQPDFLFPCKLCIYPLELDWILLLVFNFTVLWLVICLFLCFLFGLLSFSTLFRLSYLKCYFLKKMLWGHFQLSFLQIWPPLPFWLSPDTSVTWILILLLFSPVFLNLKNYFLSFYLFDAF